MSSMVKKVVIVLSVAVLGYVSTGYVLGRSSDDKAFHALTVYSEVLQRVQTDYVDEPNMRQVTSGALHGLLDSLDAESGYLSPLEYTDYRDKMARKPPAGSGIALTKRFGYIGVISVLPDSPGAKAGLHIGDIFEKIAGFSTGQMAIGQAQELLSGQPGALVKLSVIKRGKTEPEEVDLTLEEVPTPKLVEEKESGDIAYLHVAEFNDGVTKQIREKLSQLKSQGEHKLILDLRDCALGSDQEAISTAQLFLSSGTITTLKGQTVSPMVYSADPSKVVWTQPMEVLIGNGTAGPAEILAAAITGNHRGDGIGDRTFGTASTQKLIQLDDGSALILTVANYYTPDGKEIPAEGVAPTLEVRPVADDVAELNDLYPPPPSSSPTDPLVKKAIEMLQTDGAAKKAA